MTWWRDRDDFLIVLCFQKFVAIVINFFFHFLDCSFGQYCGLQIQQLTCGVEVHEDNPLGYVTYKNPCAMLFKSCMIGYKIHFYKSGSCEE